MSRVNIRTKILELLQRTTGTNSQIAMRLGSTTNEVARATNRMRKEGGIKEVGKEDGRSIWGKA